MKYCSKCGQELHDDAVFCNNCGCQVAPVKTSFENTAGNVASSIGNAVKDMANSIDSVFEKDTGSELWTVLGLFLPIIGLALYFVWKKDQPRNAKNALKGALIGIGISLAIIIISVLFSLLPLIILKI